MKFRELAISDSAVGLIRLGSVLFCAMMGWGVWTFVITDIVGTVVDAFLKRWFSRHSFTYHYIPEAYGVKEVRGYISSLVGINLAVYANTNGDNLIIGRALGTQALGYYNLAYQLAMLPTFVLSQINRVSFSVLSQRDNEEKRVYICRTLELYALIYAPIYGIGFIVAPKLIPFVYGSEWSPSVILFQIVLVFAYARGFMSILGTALNALNKPNINAAINWVLVPVSISAFIIGVWLAGVKGVAIAVALVMGIIASIWFWLAICYTTGWSIKLLLTPVILPTVTIILALAAVFAIPLPISLSPYLDPVILIIIYSIIISIISAGRIPRMLIDIASHSINWNIRRSINK